MPNTISVKYQNHFKLYVLFKDYIFFESLLQKNEIDYYAKIKENSFVDGGLRYFLLDKDRQIIDELLKENAIVASTETISVSDYRETKKIVKFEIVVYIVVIALVIFAILLLD